MNGTAGRTVGVVVPAVCIYPPHSHRLPSGRALLPLRMSKVPQIRAVSLEEIPPNALRRKRDPQWRGGFSLGVDLGMSRTGLALSKGFTNRPLTVLELRGQKLELRLLEIAQRHEVDEFIIGLPKSYDGKETQQSNKVRSVAGRLAVRAAESGWRVYLLDEHGTSTEAMSLMIDMGLSKSARQGKIDAYAAMGSSKCLFKLLSTPRYLWALLIDLVECKQMVLERYFALSGEGIELVLPKQLELQEKLRIGPPRDMDFLPEQFDD